MAENFLNIEIIYPIPQNHLISFDYYEKYPLQACYNLSVRPIYD